MNKLKLFLIILICNFSLSFFKIYNDQFFNFSKIPILFEGKIKPLSSFSKSLFNDLNISTHNKSDIELLSELFLNFDNFSKFKIFYIKNDKLINNLNLKLNTNNYYSFDDIFFSLKKNYLLLNSLKNIDYDNKTLEQHELLNLYYKIIYILNIKNYFSTILSKDSNNIYPLLNYNNYKNTFYFINSSNNSWIIPDDLIEKKNKNEKDTYTLILLKNLCLNYTKNLKEWKMDCNKFSLNSFNNISKTSILKVYIELFYNKINLIYFSFLIYLFSFLIYCIFYFFKINILSLNIMFLSVGFFYHSLEIILRIYLAERPPVTNLYESIVFVNFLIIVYLFYLYRKSKLTFLFISCFACILQYVAYKYSIDGSNIKNMVPVLNTNFWLIFHVITITIGYSLCLISGILAHFYLFLNFKVYTVNKNFLNNLFKTIYIFILSALFFSFLGTILGGVWADQSWGRFWGWDPKENGAMLIVLWLTLILHLKKLRFFNNLFFINGVILNNIIVLLAWFGVNLLNVGLHSYGFTKNIGIGIALFSIFEFLYMLVFYFLLNKNKLNYL